MDASTIINMMNDNQLTDANELATFMTPDTDCYLMLKGLFKEDLKWLNADYVHVVSAYAAVHQPENFKRFLHELTDLSMIDQLTELIGGESVVARHMEKIFTPAIETSFVHKAQACIRKYGTIGVTDPKGMFGTMADRFLTLGFFESWRDPWHTTAITVEEFRKLWPTVLDTKLFLTDRAGRPEYEKDPEYHAFSFRLVFPASSMSYMYDKVKADLKERLNRLEIEVIAFGKVVKKKLCLQYNVGVGYASGTRETTKVMIDASGWKEQLEAEAVAFLFKDLHTPDMMKVKVMFGEDSGNYGVKKDKGKFMQFILEEGQKQLDKEAEGSDTAKTPIDAKA